MNISEQQRRQPTLAVAAAAIALSLGSHALAQQPTRENANRPAIDDSTRVARADSGTQTLEQFLQSKSLRVSKLTGMELQARSGDNLGEVDDVLRGAAPGQDMQLVVQIGGIGEAEKWIAIPLDEIQISADGDELYTNSTLEQLAATPAIDFTRAPAAAATPAERAPVDANRDAATRGAAPQPGPGNQRSADRSNQRLGDLVGAAVLDTSGDQIGEVDDIVLSTAGADSIRAVLQVGGIAGVGEKRVSLPLTQLTVERAADGPATLRVAMEVAALERLPEFEYEEQTSAL